LLIGVGNAGFWFCWAALFWWMSLDFLGINKFIPVFRFWSRLQDASGQVGENFGFSASFNRKHFIG